MMKTVKCNFKNVTDEDRAKFKTSSCLVTVSVGQQTHENERFAVIMRLVNDAFPMCIIALHDGLQRFTMALDQQYDAEYFYDAAVLAGDDWLERNRKFYQGLEGQVEVVRWQDWLTDVEFKTSKMRIIQELELDLSYKAIFNKAVSEYLVRYCKRLSDQVQFDQSRAERLCLEYLIEECAVLCLWSNTGCQYEIYTGQHNAAMQATYERFVSPIYNDRVISLPVGFNHRPDLTPQSFKYDTEKC